MKSKGFAVVFLALVLLAGVSLLAGCVSGSKEKPKSQTGQEQQVNPKPQTKPQEEKKVKLVVYFPDEQAEKLVPVTREVPQKDKPEAELVIEELIKGPGEAKLGKVIPDGARILSLEVKDGIAYVNWSKEFQANHWGGSTGDGNTVYAIVNSLTELSEIKKVQLLLEGKVEEAILGHVDTSQPLERNEDILR